MLAENSASYAAALVQELYSSLLRRAPSAAELARWADVAGRTSALDLIRLFANSNEYKSKTKITPFFPVGHYHSPVVDPSEIGDYIQKRLRRGTEEFHGIQIDTDKMLAFWDKNIGSFRATFADDKQIDARFYFNGGPFPYGDAATLHAMIGHFRPRNIVEIGSGFSTACMLDSADIHGNSELKITCIEPFPDRLKSLVRPQDYERITLLDERVQNIDVDQIVKDLYEGDILFIDSTHVLKTASDVHYEIFEIIPRVRPGVLVHIHDCPYPFEYPQLWIDRNYSWNEAYAVRAFLMYNTQFEISFWGSLFRSLFPERVSREGGTFTRNPGTSLWLQRQGQH